MIVKIAELLHINITIHHYLKYYSQEYKYFYFNRVEISQLLVNKAVYAIANLDTGLPNSTIITTNSISIPTLNFTLTETIYFFTH